MNRHALMIGLSVMSLAAATAVGGCSRRDENPTTATDPAASGSATTDSTGASVGQTPTAPDMTTPSNVDASGTGGNMDAGTTGTGTGATGSTSTQDRSTGTTPGATTSGSSSTGTSGGQSPPRN